MIWSPSLSINGSNRSGWINTISDDLLEIYESGVNGKTKTREDVLWDKRNMPERIVFMKYKDALGLNYRRFIGVYKVDRYDNNKKAEVWRRINKNCYFE